MRKYTIHQFNKDFPDEDACLESIVKMLYPRGIVCRSCDQVRKHHKLTNRKAYSCDNCGTHVYPLAGTIFEKSTTPLKSWFYAMYLMASTRCGISAKQLERELGVTYKTAWRIFKQVRLLLAEDDGPLHGTVEVDETYVGGKPRYRNGEKPPTNEYGKTRMGPRSKDHPTQKIPVVGAVERGGRVRAQVIPDRSGRNILPLISSHIMPEATVYTDEAPVYRRLKSQGYEHKRVYHTAHVYVDGDVHTNTIEGFWALLKNGIRGVYHAVGADYLQTYANEYTFRYNHRKDDTPMFETITDRVRDTRTGRYGAYSPLP
jgi:transposase-like protein